MEKLAKNLKSSFVQGVRDAVARFEKDATYRQWMGKENFNRIFTNNVVSLVRKVKPTG